MKKPDCLGYQALDLTVRKKVSYLIFIFSVLTITHKLKVQNGSIFP